MDLPALLINNNLMNDNIGSSESIEEKKSKIRERYKGVSESELDVIPAIPQDDFYNENKKKRVAVYARVSTGDPSQTSSYELQKNHYTDLVNKRPDWDLVDIYADEGISGTSLQHRDSFLRMLEDCNSGKIDIIVTKSVSRFARNVIDCIGIVRQLKAMNPPIGVYFETETIFTLNANSEMSLSFIATLAQEESHNKSEIMNSSIEMRFKRGIFLTPVLLGYDRDDEGNLIINEEEAKIVRLIFFMYLYGYSSQEIADVLTKLRCKTKKGNIVWNSGSIMQILQNERHCGDVVARKTYTPNYLDHKSKKNKRNRNQYIMKDHHESIVSRDDFIAVQRMIANAKYGKQQFLPSLRVINEGILKGFVMINIKWAGFRAEDYLSAYNAIVENSKTIPLKKKQKIKDGDFDLSGFEVTRLQFLSTTKSICISITNDSFSCSYEAVKQFPENFYVQLYLEPKDKLLAIKPSKKDDSYSVKWSKKLNDKIINRSISGKAFLPTIFSLMNWNADYKYKCLGNIKIMDKEKILIFNLNDVEVLIPMSDIVENENDAKPLASQGKNSIVAFPAEWSNTFGYSVYDHSLSRDNIFLKSKDTEFKSDVTEYKNNDLNVTDPDEVNNGIKELINHFEEENSND